MRSSSIYSQINDSRSQAEVAAWSSFAAPKNTSEFCSSWLTILCQQIDRVSAALLVLGPDENGAYSAAAVWPDSSRNMQYLGAAAEKALKERKGIVEQVLRDRRSVVEQVNVERRRVNRDTSKIPKSAFVGYPIEVSGRLHGAVILDIANPSDIELQKILRILHWGSAWLIDHYRRETLSEVSTKFDRMAMATDFVATALQESHFSTACLAVVNDLATRLSCDRVSIGFEKSGSIDVKAISNTAKFDRKTDFVRRIADAMDEVVDLDSVCVYPQKKEELGLLAHNELSVDLKVTSICSVPLIDAGHTIGVLTFERSSGESFSETDVTICKTTGMLLGPIFWLKLQNERSVFQRVREASKKGTQILFGPNHPGAKLITTVLALCLIFFSFFETEYRVSSKAIVEGSVQRAVAAPFDGYIADSFVRAGDTVKKNEPLTRLDDRDLKLDRIRWLSEREQSERKFRQALSAQDRPSMTIAQAQINQAQAQLSLAEDKLSKATLTAPFDGVVVFGDLSQLLGSPVEQGKILFEIAPLDTYRVILNVDESDISEIEMGQQGSLALSGMPYQALNFTVKQVTPVSTSKDGKNFFRVEAEIDIPTDRLRPGMEGIGKVSVGERKLLWIFTHRLVDWFRLWAWEWMP